MGCTIQPGAVGNPYVAGGCYPPLQKRVQIIILRSKILKSPGRFSEFLPSSVPESRIFAPGGEISEILASCKVIDQNGNLSVLTKQEMHWGYRQSIIREHNLIVVSAKFELTTGDPMLIKKEMESAFETKVPLLVEVGVGDNWLEAH